MKPLRHRTNAKKNSDDAGARPRRGARPADADPLDSGGDDGPSARLAGLLDQFSGASGFRALVERAEQGSEPEYLGTIALDEQLYDTVRGRWGGGRFAARITDSTGKYAGRVPPFRIAGKPRDDAQPMVEPARESAEPSRTDALLVELLAELRTSRQQPPVAAAADPFEQFSKVASAIRAAAAPALDMKEMFGMMNGMLELRERIADSAPEPTKTSGVLEAVREMKPVMTRLLDMNDQRRTVTPPLPPALSAMPTNVPLWLQPFCKYKSFLLEAADAGKGAAPIAGFVIEGASDAQWNDVAESDRLGTLQADLLAAFPELNATDARKAFAADLLQELRAALHPPAESAGVEA